jgi:hypothetical protein
MEAVDEYSQATNWVNLATAGHLRISYHISHHESFKPYTEAIVLH